MLFGIEMHSLEQMRVIVVKEQAQPFHLGCDVVLRVILRNQTSALV